MYFAIINSKSKEILQYPIEQFVDDISEKMSKKWYLPLLTRKERKRRLWVVADKLIRDFKFKTKYYLGID